MKYANVKLTFVANSNAAIHISFDPRSGSWSYIGNEVSLINANEATMNLGWIGTSDMITELGVSFCMNSAIHLASCMSTSLLFAVARSR